MSAPTTSELFDRGRRALVRDRAATLEPELLLLRRAFDECLDRLRDIDRPFERALLVGSPTPDWPRQLATLCGTVDVFDPGPRFAATANGLTGAEDRHDFGEKRYDLVVAVGTLDTVNDLPVALQLLRRAMRPDAPFIGALAGGDSLPALRSAMIDADRATGAVAARTHPRIEPSSFAGLLAAAGFVMPVVDVDRVKLRYPSLAALVRDLRLMGASNVLVDRSPARGRKWASLAATAFAANACEGRIDERIDILHFVGWSPA
ncbi:MAG: class I SAM-dependent methyltransferase [Pseudomonadota bacterium]|nr:class I SAM-dependent methyltransferase [Pseudomonadota bacterium]